MPLHWFISFNVELKNLSQAGIEPGPSDKLSNELKRHYVVSDNARIDLFQMLQNIALTVNLKPSLILDQLPLFYFFLESSSWQQNQSDSETNLADWSWQFVNMKFKFSKNFKCTNPRP